MKHVEIEIGPGEEKLGNAFEMIFSLQKLLMALSQRTEVDAILISLLLDRVGDPKTALQDWTTRISGYYSDQAVGYLGDEHMARSSEELKRRVDLWTRALESRIQSADQSD